MPDQQCCVDLNEIVGFLKLKLPKYTADVYGFFGQKKARTTGHACEQWRNNSTES